VRRLILDGYNLLFREGEASDDVSLRDLREEFLRRVDARRETGQEVTVVFDGRAGAGPRRSGRPGLRVVWARAPRSADDVIVDLVRKEPRHQVTVVTRDRELVARVKSAGGRVASPEAFFRGPTRRRSAPPGRASEKPAPPKGEELAEWERLFEEGSDPPDDPRGGR
jgi:predicted RNA-binding protein with PIN domain